MYNAFQAKADTTPFKAVPNQVPLTEGVSNPPACGPDTMGTTGAAAKQLNAREAKKVAVPAAEKDVAAQWEAWAHKQHFTGNSAVPDHANPAQMNRYTWYQTHDWKVPYPGDPKIYAPSQVPGRYLPPAENDG
jgi:hypothetical protein